METYDEQALTERLTRLDRASKTAFAAACAEQLAPLFERYARSVGDTEVAARLRTVVAAAWQAASGSSPDGDAHRAEAEALVPSDDDDGWTLELGYGQNAAAAAAYAIRTWLTNDPQEAVWAARQVYELADYAVLQGNPGLDLNTPDAKSALLASEPVQRALMTLNRTLDKLETRQVSWEEIRSEAVAGGRLLASSVP